MIINACLVVGLFALGAWAAESWVWWTVGCLIGVIVVWQLLGLAFLPSAWRRQAQQRKRTHDLMSSMLGVYANLGAHGPASAAFIRKQCEEASTKGVVWPASLFALLDDIQARGSTFGQAP